jgi:hypothetical protein
MTANSGWYWEEGILLIQMTKKNGFAGVDQSMEAR